MRNRNTCTPPKLLDTFSHCFCPFSQFFFLRNVFTIRSKVFHNAQMEDAASSEALQHTTIIEQAQSGLSSADIRPEFVQLQEMDDLLSHSAQIGDTASSEELQHTATIGQTQSGPSSTEFHPEFLLLEENDDLDEQGRKKRSRTEGDSDPLPINTSKI